MRRILLFISCTIICFFLLSNTDNFNNSSPRKEEKLFSSDSCLQLVINSDFTKILSHVDTDTSNYPGIIWYVDKDGQKKSFDIKIHIRGHFRRSSQNCDFPPLEIKFKPSQVKGSVFQNQKNLKMVTHCRSRRSLYEQYLLQEYLIYKTYNLITDYSYRVRLASITYVDSEGKMKPLTKYAFFLENTTNLARRCNLERMYVQYVFASNTDSVHVNMMSVFQYLIGNTDWSIPALHNIVIGRQKPKGPIFTIPFDFEWSGIMNTIYAVPQASLGTKSVRERVLRGYCRTPEQFENAFAEFRKNKEKIYAVYQNQEGLERKELTKALDYLDEFFKIVDNPRLVRREFLEKCRK